MTDLYVEAVGGADKPIKERKNSKLEMFLFLKDERRKNIEILETYSESAADGNATAVEKCIEARSKNELIEQFMQTFLKSIEQKTKVNGITANKSKDWLYEDCIQTYVHFFIRENKLGIFADPQAIKDGMNRYEFISMRAIIKYLAGITNGNEQRVLDGWQLILNEDTWSKMPEHIKRGHTLAKIRMRINEIISIIKQNAKNGTAVKVGENTTIINPNGTSDSADKAQKQNDLAFITKLMYADEF